MATPIISDHNNSIEPLTNQIEPKSIQKLSSLGLMDFSNFENAVKFCEIISKTEMCPKGYRGKPFEVMCAIQYGHELGLSPFQAMHSIAVINGKPSIYGDGLIGLCLAFPECEDIQETFDEATMTATCIVKRKNHSPVIHTYNPEKATKAKLWKKPGPWAEYPERMLQMRARGFALRDAFADRLKGIITAEEARDYPTQEERHLNVIRPIHTKVIPQAFTAKIKEETKNHLKFLIAQCEVPQVTINKWFKKANVNGFEGFTEEQAIKAIEHLESHNFEAKQAWIDFVKVREAYEHEQQMQDIMNDEQGGVAAHG